MLESGNLFLDQSREFYWKAEAIEEFLAFAGNPGPGARVLEVGCGNGFLTQALARRLSDCTVLGIDLNPDVVAEAERRRRAADIPNVRFQAADAGRSGLPEGGFDLTLCHYVLVDCSAPDAVLAEMARVTRPGGVVVCIEPIYQTDLLHCYMPGVTADERTLLASAYRKLLIEKPAARGIDRAIAPSLPARLGSLNLQHVQVKVQGQYGWSLEYSDKMLSWLAAESRRLLQAPEVWRHAVQQALGAYLTAGEIAAYAKLQMQMARAVTEDPAILRDQGWFTAGMHLMVRAERPETVRGGEAQ